MDEKTTDAHGTQSLEELEQYGEVLGGKQSVAKGGRSRKADETLSEEPAMLESEGLRDPGKAALERAPAVQGQAMGRLTISELEMMSRMEELSRLEEISVGGTTNIETEVIGSIAGVAVQAVEGVASLGTASLRRAFSERMGSAERRGRGVSVEAGRREVILDINLRIIYGYSIPLTVIKVRQIVADRLLKLCGLLAKEINIRVIGIEFPARMPGRVQ